MALLLLAIASVMGLTATAAVAVTTKTVHVDCNAQQPGWVWGTVYLFSGEQLTISFEDCDWDLNNDIDTDPANTVIGQTLGNGDGSMTFSADGTYVINSTITQGSAQGQWFDDGEETNYVYLTPIGSPNSFAYVGIDIIGSDVTNVPGKSLLSSPSIDFPVTIDGSDLFVSDQTLANCLIYDPSAPGDTYAFVETPFTTNVAGDFLFRTISTNPITSFTNYVVQPDGYRGMTPLLNVNYLIYENFDPQNPAVGLLGCGDERIIGGDYLSSGEILSHRYFETEVSLPAGTYTIVAAHIFPTTVQDWNANVGWTPFDGQAVNAQVWGPAQSVPTETPTLAQTGGISDVKWEPWALIIGGIVLVVLKRKSGKLTQRKTTR